MQFWSGTAIYPAFFKDLKNEICSFKLSNQGLAVDRPRCDLLSLFGT